MDLSKENPDQKLNSYDDNRNEVGKIYQEENKSTIWQKIMKEIKPEKKLFPLKLLGLLFFGGMFCVTPFYTLHMQQLGLTVKEIAIIYTILPIPAITGPIISGMLADWSRNFNAVLSINILLTIIFNLSTVFTPLSSPPITSLSLVSDVSAISHLRCLGGDLTTSVDGNNWSCNTNCFGVNISTIDMMCMQTISAADSLPKEGCQIMSIQDARCYHNIYFIATNETVFYYNLIKASSVHSLDKCSVQCNLTDVQTINESEFTNSQTFWVYFLIRIFAQYFTIASFTMMDASIMAVMLKLGSDYGKQRIVAMMSLATMPFLASCIVSARDGPTDYSPVFYLHAALLFGSIVMLQYIDLSLERDKEEQDKDLFKEIKELLMKREVCVFIAVLFLLGSNWGYLENFLFFFLNSLDAPPYLLGLTMTFGCIVGVPMLIFSDRLVEYFGREKIFFMGFLAYTVRMFGYSFITNPWYCFIFESLEIFTYQLMWVAAVTYFPLIAPIKLLGTLSGIAGCVHYNIGRGIGSLVGGFLISSVGLVWTFRVFGTTSFLFAFLYLFLQRKVLIKAAQTDDENFGEKEQVEKILHDKDVV